MYKYQKGQAILIVILVMVVALTVGLSVAVRTTTNIKTTSEEQSSQRAFSAAEAGIERSLSVNPASISAALLNNSNYSTTVAPLSGASFLLNNGTTILKDKPVDVWLAAYPDYASPWTGNLTINWGQTGNTCTGTQAALEIILISGSKASPTVSTYAFDPCSDRRTGNQFSTPTGGDTINGQTFAYKTTAIPVTNGLIARIIPLYAPAIIGIKTDALTPLPSQGTVITSTGTSDSTKRKIVSFRGYPKLPVELFQYIIFSP